MARKKKMKKAMAVSGHTTGLLHKKPKRKMHRTPTRA